jgi:hypothetical protein
MLQKVFTKYWLAVNIGICTLLTWLVLPGSVKDVNFSSLLLMSILLAELFILLPSVLRGETLAAARVRAVKSLSWDGFAYVGLFLVLYLGVQWLNGGRLPEYDTSAGVWNFAAPAVAWLPSSVDRVDAFRTFNIFAALLVTGCCLRHAAGKRAKRMLLQWLCMASGIFAAYAVFKGCSGAEPYSRYMNTPLSSSFGTFFGFWLLVSIGSFAEALSAHTRKPHLIYLFGIAGNLVGMLFFSTLPGMMLYGLLSVLLFGYMGAYLSTHVSASFIVKTYLLTAIIVVSAVVLSVLVFPESAIAAKVGGIAELPAWWTNLMATRAIRTDAAMAIWQDHLWYGTGTDGFEYYLGFVLDDAAWSGIRMNKGAVYNDVLQVLCEFGVLGGTALAALIVTLMIPLCHRAHVAWVHDTRDSNAGRKYLLRISPLVVTGVLATLCCFAESFFASPFRMPAILISFFVVMLVMPAFLPSRGAAGQPATDR